MGSRVAIGGTALLCFLHFLHLVVTAQSHLPQGQSMEKGLLGPVRIT